MKYIVKVHEVWARPIEVEADNESDAIIKARKRRGETDPPDHAGSLSLLESMMCVKSLPASAVPPSSTLIRVHIPL